MISGLLAIPLPRDIPAHSWSLEMTHSEMNSSPVVLVGKAKPIVTSLDESYKP
jgi:hypothetical protein